jgi:anti-sigma regulatory factor (Ser/Thr protein kinase)
MNLTSSSSQESEPVLAALVIKNSVDELARLSHWINELANQFGVSPEDTFRLDLASTEAVTNIIEHAFDDDNPHYINITFEHKSGVTKITIEDDGTPFDPLLHPEVVLPRNLEDAGLGGLGIHLIRNYVDEWYFRREAEKNILTMIIYHTTVSNA